MTNPPSSSEQEPQWAQPPFATGNEPKDVPVEGTVSSGSVMVPRGRIAPPSVAETFIATVGGLVWPVMIVLALMGLVSWWPAILAAIVTSTVLGNVRGHMKARRKALGRGPGPMIPPSRRDQLR